MELAEEVYSAGLPRRPDLDDEVGNFVAFGQIADEYTYSDGTKAGGLLMIPAFLWERMGRPEQLMVAMSENEFICIKDDGRPYAEQLSPA